MARWFYSLSPTARALLSGCAGFVAYGAWAYWINQAADSSMGMRAALIQGTYSFVLTVCMTAMMDGLLDRLERFRFGVGLTVILSSTFNVGVAAAIHWWANTPEILLTILPGAAIGLGYAISYATGRQRSA